VTPARPRTSRARDRLLKFASDLFYREGIHSVELDSLLGEAKVTRATMYRHFSGKEDLVAAYLTLEDQTIRGYFEAAETAAGNPRQLLELIIDGIINDVERYHTRGCPFINASAEFPDENSRIRRIVREHRDWFRATLTSALEADGHASAQEAAAALVLLRDAALVGGYLDGADTVRSPFISTARTVAGLAA
jgi:AcrR family transcriptional regulator